MQRSAVSFIDPGFWTQRPDFYLSVFPLARVLQQPVSFFSILAAVPVNFFIQ